MNNLGIKDQYYEYVKYRKSIGMAYKSYDVFRNKYNTGEHESLYNLRGGYITKEVQRRYSKLGDVYSKYKLSYRVYLEGHLMGLSDLEIVNRSKKRQETRDLNKKIGSLYDSYIKKMLDKGQKPIGRAYFFKKHKENISQQEAHFKKEPYLGKEELQEIHNKNLKCTKEKTWSSLM